jgi:hypothetical protein
MIASAINFFGKMMKNTETPFPGGPRSPSARTAGNGKIKALADGSQRAAGKNTRE